MDKGKYLNAHYNTIKENNALKFTLFSLILVILIEGFFIVRTMNTQRTIVIPSVKGKYVIMSQNANKDYLIQMGYYFTQLMENFTPKTVKRNYDRFLDFLSPDVFGDVQSKIMAIANNYVATDTSSWFIPKKYSIAKDKIIVMGVRKLIVGNKIMSTQSLIVTIGYKMINGKLEVTSYDENANKNYNY